MNYGKRTAEIIIGNCCDDLIDIRDDGVWPTSECLDYDTSQYFHWNFACDLQSEDDALEVPHLPIPFTGSQLAVFMLDGVGSFLQDFYGDWKDGPDEEKLAAMGIRAEKPRQALRDAYTAYCEAEKIVGKVNESLELCTARTSVISLKKLRKAMELRHRLEHDPDTDDEIAKLEHAKLERAIESANKWKIYSCEARSKFENAFAIWRKAMVKNLLNTDQIIPKKFRPDLKLSTSICETRLATQVLKTAPLHVEQGSAKVIVHSIKNRVQLLDTEILEAKRRALDANEPASVWAELIKMALGNPPEGSFIGHSSDGIQYQGRKYQTTGVPDTFTLKNLRNRMLRAVQRRKAQQDSLSLSKLR